MTNNYRTDLLDDILSVSSLEYLSDLKDERNRNEVAAALTYIKQDRYSMRQWEIALTYILKKDVRLKKNENLAACFEELTQNES